MQPESHPFALPGLVKGSDLLTESLRMSWFIQSSWSLNSNSIEIRSEWCGWTLGTPPKLHAFNKPSILRLVHPAVAATHRQIPAGRQDSPTSCFVAKTPHCINTSVFFSKDPTECHLLEEIEVEHYSESSVWMNSEQIWAVPHATERAGFPEERWELWSGLTVRSPMVLGRAMIQPWAMACHGTMRPSVWWLPPGASQNVGLPMDCPVCFS